jgi:hypothetical protein
LIGTGKAGGSIFALFRDVLVTTWLPAKLAPIVFELSDGMGRVLIDGYGAAESELLSYPDGSVIRPTQDLPHGIEFKRALMTNSKRWWWKTLGSLNGGSMTPVATKIIGSYLSPYVRKVLVCLDIKGIAYQIDPIVPFYGNDEFARLSRSAASRSW